MTGALQNVKNVTWHYRRATEIPFSCGRHMVGGTEAVEIKSHRISQKIERVEHLLFLIFLPISYFRHLQNIIRVTSNYFRFF